MKKEKFIKRFFSSKFFFFIGLVVLGFLFFALGEKILGNREIDKEIQNLEREIARLEEKNNELNNFLNYLNTETFVEQEARLKFNLQKPGESVMIVPEDSLGETKTKENVVAPPEEESFRENPGKWWNYFFN